MKEWPNGARGERRLPGGLHAGGFLFQEVLPRVMEPRPLSTTRADQSPRFRLRREVTYRKIDCAHCGKSAIVVVSPTGDVLGVV